MTNSFNVKLLIGANAYACISHDGINTDIRLAPGKSESVALAEYAAECDARAAAETGKADLARRAAAFLSAPKQ